MARAVPDPHALARSIVSERRFHPAPVPRPLHSVLVSIGNAIESAFGTIGHVPYLWPVLVVLVAAGAVALSVRLIRGRERAAESAAFATPDGRRVDPTALEREALAAERAGELERALRLRFRAGLLRLDDAELIDLRPGLTSGAIAARLHSARFDGLARSFDEVVYGGRTPATADVEDARSEWPRLLREARR